MTVLYQKQGLILAMVMWFLCGSVFAQSGTLTGTLTDPEGEPIAGATVRIDRTTLGAATDQKGNYSISSVPTGSQT
ncbi:MAG: carboxypeptidase regulatory-like domain-containing protein, partial [Bacteroidota bacterium]